VEQGGSSCGGSDSGGWGMVAGAGVLGMGWWWYQVVAVVVVSVLVTRWWQWSGGGSGWCA